MIKKIEFRKYISMISSPEVYVTIFCLAFYFIAAALYTNPFIFNPQQTLTAPINGDNGYSAIKFEAIKREGLNPFVDNQLESIAYPDSQQTNVSVDRVSFLSTLFLWKVTGLTNSVFAHSLLSFLGIFMTAAVTYFFAKSISGSKFIALIAGYMYGFFPLMITLAFSASTYTHMWLFILPIWAFWALSIRGYSKKRLAVAVASVLPAMFWTPYYTFHVLLLSSAVLLASVFWARKINGLNKTLRITLVSVGSWLVFSIIYIFVGLSSGNGGDIPSRTINEAYQQSSHPLMYILPGTYSLWGSGLNLTLTGLVPRAINTNLYLGVSTFLAALTGLYFLVLQKVESKKLLLIQIGMAITILAFLFSLPPTIKMLNLNVPTPNKIVVKIVPALRAGQRLAMPMMAGLITLAISGIILLTQKLSKIKKYLLFSCILLILVLDFLVYIPDRTTTFVSNPALSQLRGFPKGLLAHYNHSSLVGNPGQYICFAQFEHNMPIVNDCAMDRDPYNFDKPKPTLARIVLRPLCEQPEALYNMGVKYVIIKRGDIRISKCMNGSKRVILEDSQFRIYEL